MMLYGNLMTQKTAHSSMAYYVYVILYNEV
jgi:hypothetical protein